METDSESHAVGSTRLFVMVWIWLAAITVIEVFLAYERSAAGVDAGRCSWCFLW